MTPRNDKKKKTRSEAASSPRIAPRTPVEDLSLEEQIVGAPLLGKVRAYDPKTRHMRLILEVSLSVGDGIRVKGRSTDLIQRVERILVGRNSVQSALPAETVFVEVADPVQPGDAVFKVRSA